MLGVLIFIWGISYNYNTPLLNDKFVWEPKEIFEIKFELRNSLDDYFLIKLLILFFLNYESLIEFFFICLIGELLFLKDLLS